MAFWALVLIGISISSGCCLSAAASDYYVAPDGVDSDTGTETRPWRSVRKAAAAARAGDTVFVKNGTYYERIVVTDSGTPGAPITIRAYPGHKPVLSGRDHAQWDGFVNLSGASYVRLEGLAITACGKGQAVYIIHRDGIPATHIQMKELTISDVADSPVQIRGNACHILVENCVIFDCGASGIDVSHFRGGRPHHVTIRGNTIYNSKLAGIGSEVADHLLVDGNTCRDCRLGIDIGSGDFNVIRSNTIYRCENGIALSSNEDSLVYGNVIHDVSEAFYAYFWSANGEAHARNKWYRNVVRNATWAIYEMNSKMSRKAKEGPTGGHMYFNNLFCNIGGNPGYRSPFWFRGVSDFSFCNNTIVMKPGNNTIELARGCKGGDFRNNIVHVAGKAAIFNLNGGSQATIDYNCYWDETRTAEKVGRNDIVERPLFTDAAEGNWTLRATSPCVDRGMQIEGFHDDLNGHARPQGKGWDMGAYECTSGED